MYWPFEIWKRDTPQNYSWHFYLNKYSNYIGDLVYLSHDLVPNSQVYNDLPICLNLLHIRLIFLFSWIILPTPLDFGYSKKRTQMVSKLHVIQSYLIHTFCVNLTGLNIHKEYVIVWRLMYLVYYLNILLIAIHLAFVR